MIQILILTITLGMACTSSAAENYANVKFGPYTNAAHEDDVIGNLAPLMERCTGKRLPQVYLTGRRRAFSFGGNFAKVSTVTITGPYGVVYTHQFDPPVPSTGMAIYDLPPGPYSIRSYNEVGMETESKIWIAEIEPELDLEGVHGTVKGKRDSVRVHLPVKARASEGLHRVELIQNGKLTGVVHGNGRVFTGAFDADISLERSASTQFILQVSDLKGNYRQLRFSLRTAGIPSLPGTEERIPLADRISLQGGSRPWRTVPEGKKYELLIGNGLALRFKNVSNSGEVSSTLTTMRPKNGYFDAIGAAFILRAWNGLKFKSAQLTIDYAGLDLSPGQISALKIVKADSPLKGIYPEMPARNRKSRHQITANLTDLGTYILQTTPFKSPHILSIPKRGKGKKTRIEFISGATAKLSSFDMSSDKGRRILMMLKSRNMLPVGDVYSVWPEDMDLDPSGAVYMRYMDSSVSALGMQEDSLAIYTLDPDRLYRLPYLTSDTEGNLLTAMVPRTYAVFAVIGSSVQAENVPPEFYPDRIPPSSDIAFDGPKEGENISTSTRIVLTAKDPQYPSVLTSGLKGIYYFIQPEKPSRENIQLSTYTQPFTLPEGEYTLQYLSEDKAGNYEFPKSIKLSVEEDFLRRKHE